MTLGLTNFAVLSNLIITKMNLSRALYVSKDLTLFQA
jgi:hypothetical protein